MKKVVIAIAASTALATAAGSAIAKNNHHHKHSHNYSNRSDVCWPYVGVEYKYQHMNGNSDYKRIFPDNYHGATVYLGGKFHKHFGAEVGYSHSARSKRHRSFNTTDALFGTAFPQAVASRSKVRVTSYQLDVNGYYPVANSMNLIATLGVGGAKAKIRDTDADGNSAQDFSSHKRKAIARAGVGTEWTHGRFGLRGIIRWEGTGRLRSTRANDFTLAFPNSTDKTFKNSFSLNVGGNVRFM